MKFVCDSCGKRFASVDEPAPGRVYRIRCRCGHVILVRGPAAAARDAEGRPPRFEPPPPPPPPSPPLAPPPPQEPEYAPSAPPLRADPAPGLHAVPSEERTGAVEAEPQAQLVLEAAPSAPPRESAGDATEPALPDDPFLRAVREAAPVDGGADAARSGEPLPSAEAAAQEKVAGTARTDAPRAERPRLSLGLEDEGASGASRRILVAALVALALLAAIAAWMTLRT